MRMRKSGQPWNILTSRALFQALMLAFSMKFLKGVKTSGEWFFFLYSCSFCSSSFCSCASSLLSFFIFYLIFVFAFQYYIYIFCLLSFLSSCLFSSFHSSLSLKVMRGLSHNFFLHLLTLLTTSFILLQCWPEAACVSGPSSPPQNEGAGLR